MGASKKSVASKDAKAGFNLIKWLKSGKGQRATIIVLFMLIPLFLLVLFTYLPFAKMVQFSFYKMKYLGDREYIGFDNYVDVFQRKDIFSSLKLSLYYLGASFVQLALSLYFATILSFKVKGGGFFKGAMFFPYLVNGIAIGFIFQFFFTRGFVLDTLLSWIGFNEESLPYWLKDRSVNNISLAGTSVWRYMGQNMVLFIGAIMSIDSDLYEAAELDGANRWHQFKYIILPGISTIVVLNLILSISGSLSAFEPCFVITKGGMGTATYFYKMHKIAHLNQKVGLACAMAIVLFVIIIIVTILQKVVMGYLFSDGDEDTSRKTMKKMRKARERR